jgi:hypothetical protein
MFSPLQAARGFTPNLLNYDREQRLRVPVSRGTFGVVIVKTFFPSAQVTFSKGNFQRTCKNENWISISTKPYTSSS